MEGAKNSSLEGRRELRIDEESLIRHGLIDGALVNLACFMKAEPGQDG